MGARAEGQAGRRRALCSLNEPPVEVRGGRESGAGGKGMGWAAKYIEKLQAGEKVSFPPRGHSMKGRVGSGQLCTVEPTDPNTLKVGDIVLCKVRGREFLHLIKAIQGPRFQIGNNRGHINGWITAGGIFGRCVKVED